MLPFEQAALAHRDAVDGDGAIRAADGLPWKGKDALQERHAFGQITAIGKEARRRFRRPDPDEFGEVEHACRLHGMAGTGQRDCAPVFLQVGSGAVSTTF